MIFRRPEESAEILCCFFRTGFNFILDTSKIPQMWQKGEITPVHKKECTRTKENYRPLTILPSLS